MKNRYKTIFLIALILTIPSLSYPNEKINNQYDDYYHVTGLLGLSPLSFRNYRSFSVNDLSYDQQSEHLWKAERPEKSSDKIFSIIDPDLNVSYNSEFPFGNNDGSQWQGKGFNSVLSGGVIIKPWLFTFTYYPDIWYAQNDDYSIIPGKVNRFGDYAGSLDRPQRFGSDALYKYYWGQSGVRFDYNKFTIGYSTENFWIGPSIKNPILMSDNARGFPHINIGTNKPVNTSIGDFEAMFIWGQTKESAYFDKNPDNNYNLFVGYFLQYAPSFIPGFSLGFNRVFVSPWATIDTFKIFPHFDAFFKESRWKKFDGPDGEDDIDQLLSFVFNFNLRESGANLYCEIGYNDHSGNLKDLSVNPEHAIGVTLGFKKAYNLISKYLLIEGEYTKLGNNETTTVNSPRPTGSWYRHTPWGYTNKGQVMGAAIGPGSNSQYLGAMIYYNWGSVGCYVQRVACDIDYSLEKRGVGGYLGYNVQMIGGLKGIVFISDFDLYYDLSLCHNYNYNFIYENDLNNYYVKIGSRRRF